VARNSTPDSLYILLYQGIMLQWHTPAASGYKVNESIDECTTKKLNYPPKLPETTKAELMGFLSHPAMKKIQPILPLLGPTHNGMVTLIHIYNSYQKCSKVTAERRQHASCARVSRGYRASQSTVHVQGLPCHSDYTTPLPVAAVNNTPAALMTSDSQTSDTTQYSVLTN